MEADKVILITTKQDLQDFMFSMIPKQKEAFKWVSATEAMQMLDVSLRTLQNWRREGKITWTQSTNSTYLYSIEWINSYLERNSHKAFK